MIVAVSESGPVACLFMLDRHTITYTFADTTEACRCLFTLHKYIATGSCGFWAGVHPTWQMYGLAAITTGGCAVSEEIQSLLCSGDNVT